MLELCLVAQLAASAVTSESNYSSPALAAFVAAAAGENRNPPAALLGYRARVESELSLLVRDTIGREHVAQVEQVAMRAAWRRGESYALHVVGYRSQTVGVPYSTLSFARSWTLPYLYGNRLAIGVEFERTGRRTGDSAAARRPSGRPEDAKQARTPASNFALRTIHPLAADRDRFYRFSGGDTVAQLRSHDRVIPIVRVLVVPALDSIGRGSRIGAFEGEIDFDATRHQIVRMRGQFVSAQASRGRAPSGLTRLPGLVAVAFVEFVNAEVDGRYWLPAFQRSEFQATFAPFGPSRSVFRIVSRFVDLQAESASDISALGAGIDTIGADTATSNPRLRGDITERLSFAGGDSVSRYRDWNQPLGSETSSVSASDFDDLAPDVWRASGRMRIDITPAKLDEIFRFNRVEGAYTGVAARVRFRDAAPGLTARAYGGWAWKEQTARGGALAMFARGTSTLALRAERALATTNDFTAPLQGGSAGLFSLFGGVDDQDYVDRRAIALGLTRAVRSVETALVSVEVGLASDRQEAARLERGLFGFGSRFRFNRGAYEGQYSRVAATVELHPGVTGLFLEPGVGASLNYELARGALNWQRTEIVVSARRSIGALTFATRAQGGVVVGRNPPPQSLLEMGGESALPGYGYKEFAGDRAATAGLLASYGLPVLRRPIRVKGSLVVPGVSPGIAAGVQAGWAEISSPGARAAVGHLDPNVDVGCDSQKPERCTTPISGPTGGVRATADIRVTLFGGMLGIGVARPVDRKAPWRLAFRVGQEF
jgi:hypothetical protein